MTYKKRDTETHKKNPCEDEDRVMYHKPRNTKDYQQAPEAGRGKEGVFPVGFRGKTAQLWTSRLPNGERISFYGFKLPSLWYLITGAPGN